MSKFTDYLKELRDGWAPAEEINNGLCADFATVVWERFPTVEVLSDEDLGRADYTHTFLRYHGRYYDAEAVDGVDNWEDLPIFARQASEAGPA